jgi:hypothetical protein
VQDAADVHVNHAVPFVDFKFVQRRKWHDAGVVHEDVDGPEFFLGESRERFHILEAGDVERSAFGRAAGWADFGDDAFQTIGAAGAEKNFGAFASEKAAVASPMPLLAPVMRTTLF